MEDIFLAAPGSEYPAAKDEVFVEIGAHGADDYLARTGGGMDILVIPQPDARMPDAGGTRRREEDEVTRL